MTTYAGAILNAITFDVPLPIDRRRMTSADRELERTKKRDSKLIYAEQRLRPWSDWAMKYRHKLGYPTVSAIYKAMMTTKVGIIRRKMAEPFEDKPGHVIYPITARGSETRSMRPLTEDPPTEAVQEVDEVVAGLPKDLHTVIIAEYFTYGPIEVKCKQTPWKRARYSQLLEAAKYGVYIALDSRTKLDI